MPSLWPFGDASLEASSSSQPTHPTPFQHNGLPSSCSSTTSIPPLVICEGFLSAAQSVVWGNEFRTFLGVGHQQLIDQLDTTPPSITKAEKPKRRSGLGFDRPVIFVPIGPVSSLHDRACELFYALHGGTVDYGYEHAREHGHSRYGRHYEEPLCPSWGPRGGEEGLPAHFLGHSLGGPTILKLQQLLRQGFFNDALGIRRKSQRAGKDDDAEDEFRPEDLILSVTSVSSPFRGTPLVYSLGSEPLPYPKVRMLSFGSMLSKLVHIAAYLDLPFFDAHADAWHFSAKRRKALRRAQLAGGTTVDKCGMVDDPESGLSEKVEADKASGLTALFKQLWKSDWAEGRDSAPWDCTFAERDQDRAEDGWGLEQHPQRRKGRTWYRSYTGGMTVPDHPPEDREGKPGFHAPETYWSLSPLTLTSHLIGHFDYSRLQPVPSFLQSKGKESAQADSMALAGLASTWWQNDGVVPVASQFHPLDCHSERCRYYSGMKATLPFGKRKPRPQSMSLSPAALKRSSLNLRLTPASETSTLVDPNDVDDGLLSLPTPVAAAGGEHPKEKKNMTMLGPVKTVAKVALLTSLRSLNLHNPPVATPSDEEMQAFLPEWTTATIERESPASPVTRSSDELEAPTELDSELLSPAANKWYTFELDHIDHTSLCPFWTGSEIQKQFWTGIGFFLASVDRIQSYPTVEPRPQSAP